jgi:hypothetical protein
MGAQVRYSGEPDFHSLQGTAVVRLQPGDRASSIAAFLGVGEDFILPLRTLPGDGERWPARALRVYAGASFSHVAHRRLIVGGGGSVLAQHGTLESPYRAVLVRTTSFPERLPDTRVRTTAFLQLAAYLGGRTALHLRQGAYADGWGVVGITPEAALAFELDRRARWLLRVTYRYTHQTPGTFFETRYEGDELWRSGDPRLGRIHAHTPGLSLRWTTTLPRGPRSTAAIGVAYDPTLLRYASLGIPWIQAHLGSLYAAFGF